MILSWLAWLVKFPRFNGGREGKNIWVFSFTFFFKIFYKNQTASQPNHISIEQEQRRKIKKQFSS
jgi:hypothetical protein